jgi:sialate O-acetylesterase
MWPTWTAAAPLLGPAYSDDMVLQQSSPILISGLAEAGGEITGILGTETITAKAADDGRFTLAFTPRTATTKPLSLTVMDQTGVTEITGLLIGNVYLCAGQSNMEHPVNRSLNIPNELTRAADNGLRLLMIPKSTAARPMDRFAEAVSWKAADSSSVAEFSAVCFFMAKNLRAQMPDVPVGLIHSNWGGSAASAWLDPSGVKALYGPEALAQLTLHETNPIAAVRSFVPTWYKWWQSGDEGRRPWVRPESLAWQPVPAITAWNEWTGTGLDKNPNANVWFRQTFTLSAQEASGDGMLSLGAIDDIDLTLVNGQPIGYTFGLGAERRYRVPQKILRAGTNDILIAIKNLWGPGGFSSPADRMKFIPGTGGSIPLGEGWQYTIGVPTGKPPRAPWDVNAGTGIMHNAMIAPLGPMRLAGVAWYQGESDVDKTDYDRRLNQLFAGWRRQFGDQTQMLVVQLANFGSRKSVPAASQWAQLRQSQINAVTADKNAVMVTAIDIGEPSDIHPANKNILGQRLALGAQGKLMPMAVSATLEQDNVIIVRFTGVEGGLKIYGGSVALGVELCGRDQESCQFVLPRLVDDKLYIKTESETPVLRVRHAWSDAPIVNLYDGRGLPIPGFELVVMR